MTLPDLFSFMNCGEEVLRDVVRQVDHLTSGRFVDASDVAKTDGMPIFLDRVSNQLFRFIPGGSLQMGMSEAEEVAARGLANPPPITFSSLRPTREVQVEPMLVSCTPITVRTYVDVCPLEESVVEYLNASNQLDLPAYVTFEDAEAFCNTVSCRLPLEREWEYACRAGTQTLFYWGNSLPDDNRLEQLLDRSFPAEWATRPRCVWGERFSRSHRYIGNQFGLFGMFSGEWCSDRYSATLDGEADFEQRAHVVRGGGSLFWPWQNDEWIWCMPCMRISSKDTFDGTAAIRLVWELSQA